MILSFLIYTYFKYQYNCSKYSTIDRMHDDSIILIVFLGRSLTFDAIKISYPNRSIMLCTDLWLYTEKKREKRKGRKNSWPIARSRARGSKKIEDLARRSSLGT